MLCRLVAIARGEQEYFDPSGIPTATEGCKSNALMRCCKDLGIASELWYARHSVYSVRILRFFFIAGIHALFVNLRVSIA